MYLLRPDIDWPASVDRAVWPSMFQTHYLFRDGVVRRRALPALRAEPDADTQTELGTWKSWARMQDWYRANCDNAEDCETVAIAVALGPEDAPTGPLAAALLEEIEIHPAPNFARSMGFDVADAGLVSGLSNCGYGRDERLSIELAWSKRLNTFGLIPSAEEAHEFKRLTNERVREHAPFYVFHLARWGCSAMGV